MQHPLWEEIKAVPHDRRSLRAFGCLVGGVLLVGAGILWWNAPLPAVMLAGVGGTLCVVGLAAPRLLRGVHSGWMAFALALGYVMTRVILTAVYFLLITPVGLLMRLVGRDPMHRTWDRGADSYWIARTDKSGQKERLEKYY